MSHRKVVSGLLKIRFDLITFYQCFECCQRRFVLLHSIQDSGEKMICLLNVTSTNTFIDIQMRFIVLLKPYLNLCSLRWFTSSRNVINSIIQYGL